MLKKFKRKCIICGKEYGIRTDIMGNPKYKTKKTCSIPCSKKYARIIQRYKCDEINRNPRKKYEYNRRDYLKNKERYDERNKEWTKKNPERHKDIARKWYQKLSNPRKKQVLARAKILRFINSNNGVSQTEISEKLKMAYKTIQINIAYLEGSEKIRIKWFGSTKVCYPKC